MKLLLVLWLLSGMAAQAGSARIVKVLPFYLDKKGRHALKPSLYERDAYQAHLRRHPGEISAMRFDVQWKGSGLSEVTLRIELRGTKDGEPRQAMAEAPARKKGLFGRWAWAQISGETCRGLGQLSAWRATLWSGGQQVAEQKSFLW